jgi:hypothetical protein
MGPFQLSPPPQAPPRPRQSTRAGKTAIISSSPYKNTLLESIAQKESRRPKTKSITVSMRKASRDSDVQLSSSRPRPKQNHQGLSKGKSRCANKIKGNEKAQSSKVCKPDRKKLFKPQVDDDDMTLCLYCNEHYAESGWTQCQICSQWAHDVCAGVTPEQLNFVCEMCDSQ